MDCLDEPLHLQILSSLATSLAKSQPEETKANGDATPNGDVKADDGRLDVITRGLPEVQSVSNGTLRSSDDNETEDEDWTEFEINHAISYAHYVVALPLGSPQLKAALRRVKDLLSGLLAQGRQSGTNSSPSSSTSQTSELNLSGTHHQARLCEQLIKALLWISWTDEASNKIAAEVLNHLFEDIGELLTTGGSITFPLVLLNSAHLVLSRCSIPALVDGSLATVLDSLLKIASPSNLVKVLHQNSHHSSFRHAPSRFSFIAPHPLTPAGVVTIVSEIANILLAGSLLPSKDPERRPFMTPSNIHWTSTGIPEEPDMHHSVLSVQIESLISQSISLPVEKRLFGQNNTSAIGDEWDKAALKWWNEASAPMHDGSDTGHGDSGRRESLFSLGEAVVDEEIEMSVTVLHLLNLLNLHREEPSSTHLSRLTMLLSENSTASDCRVFETAFICTSMIVRNHPALGTNMTLHIRRLLMTPLPAFESGMNCAAGDVPPAVKSASRCLAICIEMSPNDDLISSTLYSLLNLLQHGGSALGSSVAQSLRSQPAPLRDGETIGTLSTLSNGKKTEEQKMLVALTAVEVVSCLSLDLGRDDIIHLSISLLLQRLRGVDLMIESAIVTNLVPLALAASDADVVEVYRAFSQISRSAHPEDPRMTSNAVLAAQTRLARGMVKRLRCAEGYLVDLLSLFADKGTQTQMIAMSGINFETRDKEKQALLKRESEDRVSDMKAWMGALFIPLSTLLSHESFNPAKGASAELVSLFRNFWFLCVAFGLSGPAGEKKLSEYEWKALGDIAVKTPALVQEDAVDFVDSDLEYNSILRKDFAASIANKNRATLQEYLASQKSGYEIRTMSAPQTTLLIAICDLEQMRAAAFQPSIMLEYFSNESLNSSFLAPPLVTIGQKVSSTFLKQLSRQVVIHRSPPIVAQETCRVLVACTHRFRKTREVARTFAKQILETFSALLCDRQVVFTLLEILTLMRRSCEMQFTDEYSPIHEFKSDKMALTLSLTDDYMARNEITTQLFELASNWLSLAISRAPLEVQSTLQSYLNESRDVLLIDSVEMGAGLALHYCKAISTLDRQEAIMPKIGSWPADSSNLVASQFAAKNYFNGELSGARHILEQGLSNLQQGSPVESSKAELHAFKTQMADAVRKVRNKEHFSIPDLRRLLLRASSVLTSSSTVDQDVIHYLVELPMAAFTPLAIAAGVDAWTWLLREKPEAEVALLGEISASWLETIRTEKGLFSTSMNYADPFAVPVEYSPTDKQIINLELAKAKRMLRPHLLLIQVLSSQFQAIKYREPGIMIALTRLMMRSLGAAHKMSTHPLAREVRFSLLLFGFQILASSRMEALLELRLRDRLYAAAYAWFSVRPQWSFGSDRIQVGAEIKLLQDFARAIAEDHVRGDHSTSSMSDRSPALLIRGSTTLHEYSVQHRDRIKILQLLVENEISRLAVWYNPGGETSRGMLATGALEKGVTNDEWTRLISKAWTLSPSMAVHMGERFKQFTVQNEIGRLVRSNPKAVVDVPEALHYLLGEKLSQSNSGALKWLPVWAAVPPVTALAYFQPRFGNHPLILQYAMRVLEQYPVELTFFFVPQVVQGLRTDRSGYVERFIFETSKISQLFCHQIIWNMKANMYKDDNATEPDSMKPMLDRMIDMIVADLSGKAKAFYDTEFTFFDAVTSISGKLRPFIKASKPEKKAKIDEEMAKIKLEVGVYLPSNPDGVVIDLDRKAGRPLQSHAKAPFMATFKVQKERLDIEPDSSNDLSDEKALVKRKFDTWISAIFKVGDDCRQDMLALQVIAMFKNVFTRIGLVLYLFPYRVTATAPGCGVIDVVPNATSRDEMGRAKINDLLAYFIDKYGGVNTVTFQKARLNFIQSMAAYSVSCYILQIKDRHNGNIMIDGEGHIVHVDFGFLFDIGPGGIKFEPNSFKLNHEMVALMGGRESQGYKMFTELTIKAFLAIRPHADQLCDACHLMLGTGLPSFKGEGTIKRLRDRFALHLNEKQAAEFMMGVIRNAHENVRSNVYDGFQKLQNGIPY